MSDSISIATTLVDTHFAKADVSKNIFEEPALVMTQMKKRGSYVQSNLPSPIQSHIITTPTGSPAGFIESRGTKRDPDDRWGGEYSFALVGHNCETLLTFTCKGHMNSSETLVYAPEAGEKSGHPVLLGKITLGRNKGRIYRLYCADEGQLHVDAKPFANMKTNSNQTQDTYYNGIGDIMAQVEDLFDAHS